MALPRFNNHVLGNSSGSQLSGLPGLLIKTRYLPDRDFPDYAFIPGQNIHPHKPGGHSHGEKEPHCDRIDPDNPSSNKDYLYALDLFNHGYFWEAHVWWESIWIAHGRSGPEADLLKGLIKLAAAGIKFKQASPEAARGHLERARELFEESLQELGDEQSISPRTTLHQLLKKLEDNPDQQNSDTIFL